MLYLCCEQGFRAFCCFPFWMAERYTCLLMPEEFSGVVGPLCVFVSYLLHFFLILFELGSCQDRHPRANKKSNYTTCACNLDCLHEGGLWSSCPYDILSGQMYLCAEDSYTPTVFKYHKLNRSMLARLCEMIIFRTMQEYKNVKQSHYRPAVAQRVPGT